MKQNQKKTRTDNKGIVLVTVTLTDGEGERVRGNLVRTFRVSSATVSSVASVIEENFVRPDLYSLKQ